MAFSNCIEFSLAAGVGLPYLDTPGRWTKRSIHTLCPGWVFGPFAQITKGLPNPMVL